MVVFRGYMNCCKEQSSSPLGFRKELWGPGLIGQPGCAGAGMGSEGNERSLCSVVVGCFPHFGTEPAGDVLPGMFGELFFCKVLQALATCCSL